MSTTYVVTGASRGLGHEFLRQLSALPNSIVIGLVRNAASTKTALESDTTIPAASKSQIHILQADITDLQSLQSAANTVSTSISPRVDYLINNAAYVSLPSAYKTLHDLGTTDPTLLESELTTSFQSNVVGVIHTINAFLPLIQKSPIKKVISITTGMGDESLSNKYGVWEAGPYSISKIALNMVVAKYNASHGKFSNDKILFMGISPGLVDTGKNDPADAEAAMAMGMKFAQGYPNFVGPITPEKSVGMMRDVIERASVDDDAFAGNSVSHFGNKEWL